MGAKYGSILIKTDQGDLVRPVLEKIAQDKKCKFLMGPPLHGWISVFPSDDGLDPGISAAIAALVATDLFHLSVFDSDIFSYWFYRKGTLQDEYNSCPDYFEECSADEKKRLRGKPEAYKDLLAGSGNLAQLTELLSKEDFTFEEERLRQFAKILGLQNAIGSYDYLLDGEREEIKNWKQFVHVPDERAAKRQAQALLKTVKKELVKNGLLLAELLPPGPKRDAIHTCIHCCADTQNGGFLIAWAAMPMQPILSFDPLGSNTTAETGMKLNQRFFAFETSPSGRWLVASDGKVWNWRERKPVFQVPIEGNLTFDKDEGRLIEAQTTQIIITSLASGNAEFKLDVPSGGNGRAALHPDGQHLVVKNLNNISLVNLAARRIEKTLECKGSTSFELPQTAEMDEMISNLRKIWEAKDKLPDTLHNKMIKGATLSGRCLCMPVPEGVSKLEFSPRGDMLFCATTKGMRVFRWEEILLAEMDTPKPLFSADSPTDDPNGGYVMDFFFDESRQQLVFAGSFGKVCYLDLLSGKSGVLLSPPEDFWIRTLKLSSEGTALCLTCDPNFEGRNREVSKFQFWNYPALCNKAGLK